TPAASGPPCRRTRWAAHNPPSAIWKSTTRSQRTKNVSVWPARASARTRRNRAVANEAYRAVFLRVHPTGKMVLSLTTESDGHEAEYAKLVADELGVPPLDVKVVAADLDRFGEGHGYNTAPSAGTSAAIVSATGKIRDKAQLLAGMALDAQPETL